LSESLVPVNRSLLESVRSDTRSGQTFPTLINHVSHRSTERMDQAKRGLSNPLRCIITYIALSELGKIASNDP
jgi:hypothetical protein